MRPIRLELEGFTAFRERTVVDFEGVDLFVLCGPTGSGKSSLIDAMIFALYGSVPRYGDVRLVHPVITQGRQEAKVRFDFEVEGERYTAVRVVRRQKRGDGWGATVKEARLERGGESLAGSVRELDEKIQSLLGLSFEQFTSCVVLPQGEFARFLHEEPRKRQDLLKELLRIRIYDEMGRLARERQSRARQRVDVMREQLADLAGATKEAKRAAERRVRALSKLRTTVEKAQAEIEELELQREGKADEAAREGNRAGLLQQVVVPKGALAITSERSAAIADLASKERARVASEKALADAEAAAAELPEPGPIAELLGIHRQRGREVAQLATARQAATRSAASATHAEAALARADSALAAARERRDLLHRSHTAFVLAQSLAPGEPCPVCLREVEALPEHPEPEDLADARRAFEAAEQRRAGAEKAHGQALQAAGADGARVGQLEARISELEASLAQVPAPDELEGRIQAIRTASERGKQARADADAARAAERNATQRVRAVEERVRRAWEDYDRIRDALAQLEPPPPDRDALDRSWKDLARWAQTHSKRLLETVEQRRKELEALDDQLREKREAILQALSEEQVEVAEDEETRDALVAALTRAEGEVSRIQRDMERHAELSAQSEVETKAAAVAGSLARHLAANAFERWLLAEAFERLVGEGSQRLRELSAGNYSFAVDERLGFDIIDHRNADERRSARTLSGGETFLASLALALTLSEQVAELASEGASRLESMFLDEGFGTLDPDTLDTVVATIEELGARGRVIGLVTHVRELADRIPVQYRVSKGPRTASIDKVVA